MLALLTSSLAVILFACSLTQAISDIVLSQGGVAISTTDTDPTNLDTNTVYTVSFTADSTDTDPTLNNNWEAFLYGYSSTDKSYFPLCVLDSLGTFATTSFTFSLPTNIGPIGPYDITVAGYSNGNENNYNYTQGAWFKLVGGNRPFTPAELSETAPGGGKTSCDIYPNYFTSSSSSVTTTSTSSSSSSVSSTSVSTSPSTSISTSTSTDSTPTSTSVSASTSKTTSSTGTTAAHQSSATTVTDVIHQTTTYCPTTSAALSSAVNGTAKVTYTPTSSVVAFTGGSAKFAGSFWLLVVGLGVALL